jgi:outer membrane protein assembly factor BamB
MPASSIRIFVLASLLIVAGAAVADDWPNFRGPSNNGISKETGWDGKSAKELWKFDAGIGASSMVVVGNRVLTMGNKGNKDIVWCLDAGSGKVLWKHEYSSKFDKRMFEGGTAATPTVDGDRVYTLGYLGHIFCLRLDDGSVIWSKHAANEFGGKPSRWKYAGSPLVDDNLVIFDIGGGGNSTLALNKKTGAKVWGNGNDSAGYATAVPYDLGASRNVLVFKGTAMVSHDIKTGKENWRIPWKTSYDVNASTPSVSGSAMLITSGYGDGRAAMFNLGKGGKPKQVWRNDDMKTKMSSCVLYKGNVYGISQQRKGQLMCIDGKSGEVKWAQRGFGSFGTMTIAGDTVVALSEGGELITARASGDAYQELSRKKVISGRCWVNVVLANGQVYCKNNSGQLVCLSVK